MELHRQLLVLKDSKEFKEFKVLLELELKEHKVDKVLLELME